MSYINFLFFGPFLPIQNFSRNRDLVIRTILRSCVFCNDRNKEIALESFQIIGNNGGSLAMTRSSHSKRPRCPPEGTAISWVKSPRS
jgi:hypothetical protein